MVRLAYKREALMGENEYRQKAFSHLATYKKHKRRHIAKWKMELVFNIIFDATVKELCRPRPTTPQINKKLRNLYSKEVAFEKAFDSYIKAIKSAAYPPDMEAEDIYEKNSGRDLWDTYDKVGQLNNLRKLLDLKTKEEWGKRLENPSAIYRLNDADLKQVTISRLGHYYTWLTGKNATVNYDHNYQGYKEISFLGFVTPIWEALFSIVKEKGNIKKIPDVIKVIKIRNKLPKKDRGNGFVKHIVSPKNNFLVRHKP